MKMKFKKPLTIALAILLVGVIILGSFALFTDRATSNTLKLSTAKFSKDGYTISREYEDVHYAAGDDITVKVIEGNSKTEAVQSVVKMSVAWVSPDTSNSPFGNAKTADNATIQVDGTSVDYTVNKDGTITFELPAHAMKASSKNNSRNITFHIPDSLKSTGNLNFTFDGVKLSQTTAMGGTGFSAEFSHDDLNASSALDFSAKVIWDFSAAQDKSVIGSLTGSNGNYGVKVEGSGTMYNWASGTASKQSNYKDSVTNVTIGDGISNIGNYAFDGFSKITSIVIPKDVTKLGNMSFGHCEKLTDITFKESASASITFPAAGSSTGAFYVPSYLKTTFNFNGNADAKAYNWVTDNRMKDGITSATLAYDDVKVGETVNAQLSITPADSDKYQSIKYEVISGSEFAKVDANTGVVTGVKKGTATVKVTIVDANGDTVTAQGTVNVTLDTPILAAQKTWRNDALDTNILTSVTIVDSYTPDGTESASWDASDASVPGTVTAYLSKDKTSLTIAGNGYGLIFANPDSSNAFADLDNVVSITNMDLLDTRNVTNMSGMFYGNAALSALDVGSFNVSNVTDMSGMFSDVGVLSLDLHKHQATAKDGTAYTAWNPTKAETFGYMFMLHGLGSEDRNLQNVDVTGWETNSVTDMYGMFTDCNNLTEIKGISEWNTSKVTDMAALFMKCYALKSIDVSKWNTGSVETVYRMFQYCYTLKSIDISNWDMSNMTNTKEMFYSCNSFTELTLPATLSRFDEGFASSCYKLTKFTFLQPADMDITFSAAGSSTGAFSAYSLYTKTVPLGTEVVSSNANVLNYDWTKNARGFTVTVDTVTGGTVTADQAVAINGKTITLTPAANAGYTYNGATISYADKAGADQTISLASDELTFTMPVANVTVTPKWNVSTGIAYTVKHWQQNVDGGTAQNDTNFTLKETENLSGTTGASVSPAVNSYTGFTAPSKQTVTVSGDGSTVVNYYYTRNSYTVTLNKGTGIASVTGAGTYKYGQSVTIDATASNGYAWSKWSGTHTSTTKKYTFTMPASNVTDTANATVITYTISYNLNGGTLGSGKTNPTSYNVTSDAFTLNNPTKTGYTFAGWTGTNGTTAQTTVTVAKGSTGAKSYTANWTANTDTAYTVKHWQQNVDGGDEQNDTNFNLKDTQNLTGTTGASVSPAVKSYTGFAAPSKQTVTISGDGSTVVNYYYTRKSYTVTLNKGTGIASVTGAGTYRYGQSVTINATVSSGYEWSKWHWEEWDRDISTQKYTFNMLGQDMTFTANAESAATPQAIYCASDHSLTFIRDKQLYKAGNTYNGKKVTAVYTGFEEATYSNTSTKLPPWDTYKASIESVVFKDEIKPISTAYWFNGFTACSSFDVANLNTSNVTNMKDMFTRAGFSVATYTPFTITGMDDWNVSSVTNMANMFSNAGYKSTSVDIGNLDNWDVSSVTNMSYMLSSVGYGATKSLAIGDLSNWDVSSVTNMAGMFKSAGYKSPTFDIGDLGNWDVSSVTNMENMFSHTASQATNVSIGDLGRWDVSNVTNMERMFNGTCSSLTQLLNIGDLNNWDTSSVTNMCAMFLQFNMSATGEVNFDLSNWDTSSVTDMSLMFTTCYSSASTVNLDLSNWDTSSVTTMYSMFQYFAQYSTTVNLEGLTYWDVSNVTDMQAMFSSTAHSAKSFILDLSLWDVSSVELMGDLTTLDGAYNTAYGMFSEAGCNATTFSLGDLSNWDTSNVTNMGAMFNRAGYKASYTLDLRSWNVKKVTKYTYFNNGVSTKVKAPTFGAKAASLSLAPEPTFELPADVIEGTAQTISAIPDFAKLNEAAATNAPEGTTLYGWLVDSGLAKEVVLLEDFEETLTSVYEQDPEWEMVITPLYQKVQEPAVVETKPTESTDPTEVTEETKATEPTESTEATEPVKETDPTEPTVVDSQTGSAATEPTQQTEATEATSAASEPVETQATESAIDVTLPIAA